MSHGLTSAAPSLEELIAAADELRPLIAANAERGDAEWRVPVESIQALRDASLLRLLVPRRFGGHEADIRTLIEVAIAFGRADGSTAWLGNLANGAGFFVGLMAEQAQHDVWDAGPDVTVAACFTPSATSRREGDDHVVSGRWAWASGCHYADWALVTFMHYDAAGAPLGPGFGLVPMSELAIEHTWRVTGMRGTGSDTLVGNDLVVPPHRLLALPEVMRGRYPSPFTDEALYRSAFGPVLVLLLVGPIIGMAQAALEHVVEAAGRKGIAATNYARQADSVGFQLAVAEAAALIDTAHLHAARAADAVDAAARDGCELDVRERCRYRMDGGWAVRHAVRAVELLMSAHGASAFADASPLQRIWRDINTASRHTALNGAINQEVYGRALLGLDPREISPAI